MSEHRIPDIIRALPGRSETETNELASALSRASGAHHGDRFDPMAREWLRRWAPKRMRLQSAATECACASGRCGICN